MMRSNAYGFWTLLAFVGLCLCLTACGGSHEVKSQSGSTVSNSSSEVPPSISVTGDYDGDDDYRTGHDDGDNDDSKLRKDRDNDSDNSTGSYFDSDDAEVRDYGHAASAAESKAVSRLLKRYFSAAANEDGAAVCSMMAPVFVQGLPETVGRPPGPPFARGATCPAVAVKVLTHYHRQLAAHAPTLRLSALRVSGKEGVAVLAFRTLPGRSIRVARIGGSWRIFAFLDLELP